jgi:RNA polymerase sigma-70 factor, ECF subfamily
MTDPTSDDIRRARAGDRPALDRLLARSHGRLSRVARERLGDGLRQRIRTSDLLQSTYLEALRTVSSFDGENEEAFVGWLRRILENNIRDKRRYFHARKRRPEGEAAGAGAEEDAADHRFPDPLAAAQSKDEQDLLQLALVQLPPDYREVLLLRLRDHKSNKEAGLAMGRSEGAARVLVVRAKAALMLAMERLRNGQADVPSS